MRGERAASFLIAAGHARAKIARMSRAPATAPMLSYYRRPWRRVPRPIWSAWWVTLLGVVFAIAVGVPLLLERDWPLLVRWEATVGAIGVGLWMMLAVGLYRGVRVRKDEPTPKVEFSNAGSGDASNFNVGDITSVGDLGGIDDLFGGIIALILWVVFAIVLILCAPLILEGVVAGIVLLIAALAWITRRALRQVFVRGPRCRGRWKPSLGYASLYTVLYVGWLAGAIGIAHLVRG